MAAIITWASIGICVLMFLAWVVLPLIAVLVEELDRSPRRRAARITQHVTDTRDEISGIFAAAREAMDRRAGRDNSFRLGGRDRW